MSQGLTWIAGRRTPLLALVAIFALAAGMFAAFQPAHADLYDVSATTGICQTDNGIYGDDEDGAQVTVEAPDNTNPTADDDTALDKAPIKCDGENDARKTVKITPDGTLAPIVEVQSPSLTIAFDDTDGVINDDSTLKVTVSIANFNGFATEGSQIKLAHIRVSGVLDISNAPAANTAITTGAGLTANVIIPEGSPEGDYTVSARVTYNDGAKTVNASKTFTVGDPGTNVASASLELGTKTYDIARTVKDERKAESGTTTATGDIWLKVSVANSLGNPSNARNVNSITVFATGGATLTVRPATAAGARGDDSADDIIADNSVTLNEDTGVGGDEVGSTMFINVDKTNNMPGEINIWAIVTGSDGSATTDTLALTFTGTAAALTVGDAANTSPGKKTEFSVSAEDAGGNTAGVGRLRFKVTNADGVAQGSGIIKVTQATVGASTDDISDDNQNATAGLVVIGAKTAPGIYTIIVSLVGTANSEATTTVTVVGNPADVAVEASPMSSDTIGDVITVTATVTDTDGNAVADNTKVDFDVSSGTGLAGIGTGHGADDTVPTKDGVATVKYAVVGSGTSVVSASAGGATGVEVITTTAGTTAAEVEPVDGLSRTQLNNFASWSGDGSVSASELLAGITGASGLLFYDGDSWQRYGVVDGMVIPGSRDFSVRDGDVIWVSG